MRRPPPDPEKLQKVVELPVNVPADRYGKVHSQNVLIGLCDLTHLGTQPPHLPLFRKLAPLQLADQCVYFGHLKKKKEIYVCVCVWERKLEFLFFVCLLCGVRVDVSLECGEVKINKNNLLQFFWRLFFSISFPGIMTMQTDEHAHQLGSLWMNNKTQQQQQQHRTLSRSNSCCRQGIGMIITTD